MPCPSIWIAPWNDSVENICVDALPSCYCPQPYLRPFCLAFIHTSNSSVLLDERHA
jgi:hypothetical protein